MLTTLELDVISRWSISLFLSLLASFNWKTCESCRTMQFCSPSCIRISQGPSNRIVEPVLGLVQKATIVKWLAVSSSLLLAGLGLFIFLIESVLLAPIL